MTTTAYAKHDDAAIAVSLCLDQLGAGDPATLLVFCGGRHDPARVLEAVRARHGAVPVVGGSAAGAIARSGLGYSGHEIAMAAFPADVAPAVLVEGGLLSGGTGTGEQLGRRVAAGFPDESVVLMFYDGVASAGPLRLHAAAPIVKGFLEGMGGRRACLVGGGTLGDIGLGSGWVFDGEGVSKHAAVALVFPSTVEAATVILHGCVPMSDPVELTKVEGADVLEIDGRPALHVIEEMLGRPPGSVSGRDLTLVATLGERQGDPFAPYDENHYVNRLIANADPARGSITLFEPDFAEGAMVQVMSRDNAMMFSSVRDGVERMNRMCAGADCLLGLYVDCAGRAAALTGAQAEEAQLVAGGLDASIPFIGFYSGVEIAPVAGGASRALDWTGVLAVLRRRAPTPA